MRNLLISVVALFMTSTVFAQGKYFLSYEVSDNEWDTGVAVVSGAVLDEDDNGYAILGGIHLSDNLDIELGYKDFGEASLAGASSDLLVITTGTLPPTTTPAAQAPQK